jgi:hypothetical protein
LFSPRVTGHRAGYTGTSAAVQLEDLKALFFPYQFCTNLPIKPTRYKAKARA